MPRHVSPNELIRKRIQKWEDEDPSSAVTRQVEKATGPLQVLVAMLLPNTLIQEVVQKTLWVAEAMTDRGDVVKALELESFEEVLEHKIDRCDAAADDVQKWSLTSAEEISAWDAVGPLQIAPSLVNLFTLIFRTIKKTGLCYGYDTSTALEETVVLEIFAAATSLAKRDRTQLWKTVQKVTEQPQITRENVIECIATLSRSLSANLTRRRSLANISAIDVIGGGSTNAWLVRDVGWAARNIYAMRRLQAAKDARKVSASKKVEILKAS